MSLDEREVSRSRSPWKITTPVSYHSMRREVWLTKTLGNCYSSLIYLLRKEKWIGKGHIRKLQLQSHITTWGIGIKTLKNLTLKTSNHRIMNGKWVRQVKVTLKRLHVGQDHHRILPQSTAISCDCHSMEEGSSEDNFIARNNYVRNVIIMQGAREGKDTVIQINEKGKNPSDFVLVYVGQFYPPPQLGLKRRSLS